MTKEELLSILADKDKADAELDKILKFYEEPKKEEQKKEEPKKEVPAPEQAKAPAEEIAADKEENKDLDTDNDSDK